MGLCAIPSLCLNRLQSLGVEASQEVFQKLGAYCRGLEFDFLSTPWEFSQDWSIALDPDEDAQLLQQKMVSWALSGDTSLEWLAVAEPEAQQVLHKPFVWRKAQLALQYRLSTMREDAVATLEGSTGVGKTPVACDWALELLAQGKGPVLVAVPTVMVAEQWIRTFLMLDPGVQVQPVMGQAHYADQRDQMLALRAAATAQLVICTQHMLLQLMHMQRWSIIVDEAHVLGFAIAATAGRFLPIQSMGAKFETWCRDSLGLHEGGAQEVVLRGKMRQAVLAKMDVSRSFASRLVVSVVVQAEGQMIITARSPDDGADALRKLWSNCERALLLSATESVRSSAGVRSIRMLVERLYLPEGRWQDLGQVRAPWRDQGVQVFKPIARKSADGRLWLTPHSERKAVWFKEVAEVIQSWSQGERRKTLLLATSYADVTGIHEACLQLGVQGVLASNRKLSMREQQSIFGTKAIWCWIATGSAWTGMDLGVSIKRLAVSKLPLQSPEDAKVLEDSEQLRFDSVNRFQQGVGRMVRGDDGGSEPRDLVVLDGRINEPSVWWRKVCQPYLQVLGENYEEHHQFML